ncbi:MAG TPA: hypothetical protein DD640_00070 [Clostridiales bacterium]|nr:hypothetical protein [Clostridiales bacterium]
MLIRMSCPLVRDKMSEYDPDKKYQPLKIPGRQPSQASGDVRPPAQIQITLADIDKVITRISDFFCEIEYEPFPVAESSQPVAKSHKIEPPVKDEIRDLFYRMRDIARQSRSVFTDYSRFYDRRVQQDSAAVFYQQAVLMKDFADDYPDQVPFSSYFPYYQMLGYEQLRTYFTWRTGVRNGIVKPTSLSYVFLYIYELLNNVGADSPEDGLDKLVSLWTAFRAFDRSLDKYVLRWFKDYHIYYHLPHTFKDFIEKHNLAEYYPRLADPDDSFNLFCALSKYDIRKSVFFTDETRKLITGCFDFVIERVRQDFAAAGIPFDDALFRPIKKLKPWRPFKDALFYPWFEQPDRRVIFSENELYLCSKNEWTFSTILTTEKGRLFISYLLKQMESVLRKVTKYKFKLVANINLVNPETLSRLTRSGLSIDKIIESAVSDFYRETTKTVVTVNHDALARIRQEALLTQEALIVEDPVELNTSAPTSLPLPAPLPASDQSLFADPADTEPAPAPDSWENLKDVLSERELQALAVILRGADLKRFADDNNIMLEVLVDGINEKAMDFIGDNLLDDELTIYADYKNLVKGMVE